VLLEIDVNGIDMSVVIAQMAPADLEDVTAFWTTMDGIGLNESDSMEHLNTFLRRNVGLSLIARSGGRVVGAVLCGHDGRRGYLHHLAVAPSHRRQRIGTALVERCLSNLAILGIQKCNIFLYADNDDGAAFWRKTAWLDRSDLKLMQRPTAGQVHAIIIRRADSSDSPILAELNQRLIRDEGHRNRMSLAELESRMKKWLTGEYAAHLFELNTAVIGYALYRRDSDCIYIRQFFIRSDYRRRGHGRYAFEWLVKNVWTDQRQLRLEVLVENHVGIAFWRSLGFAEYCITMERANSTP
jgi:ribosomal protein S18 acetylase RimI-like enzyme